MLMKNEILFTMSDLLNIVLECDLRKLKIFVDDGRNVNCEIPDTDGCTILHILAGMGANTRKDEIISYLLGIGANPNVRSSDDLTPVHIAAMWNNHHELEKLIQNGGNPWLTDNEDKNAFDMAADHHAYEAYQLLNQYLAENKLNFRSANDLVNQSLHLTHYSDAFTDRNSFYSAHENFPLVFSSDDESKSYLLDISRILKKNFVVEDNEHTNACNNNTLQKKYVNKNLFDNFAKNLSNDKKPQSDINNECVNKLTESNKIKDIFIEEPSSFFETHPKPAFSSSTFIITDWKSFRSDLSFKSSSSLDSGIQIPEKYNQLSNSAVFQELKNLGEKPGPVNNLTREVYLKRLTKLKSGCFEVPLLPEPKYCPEVYRFLNNELDMMEVQEYVHSLMEEFDNSALKEQWREGSQKSCFNYFLLDPRVTQNLPARYPDLSFDETFQIFLDAVFYVGKGTKARSYDHLLDAVKAWNELGLKSAKIQHILDIWSSGFGVISLHCFNNCIPVEAYTQEACIIEAIGLKNLTNVREGDYYGQSTKWKRSKRRKVGISLLNRALHIFLCEGEKQIKPRDLHRK